MTVKPLRADVAQTRMHRASSREHQHKRRRITTGR